MPRSLANPQKRVEARRRVEEMIREQNLWGQRLLGERELAAEIGVGRKTLRGALAELEGEGLLERRQGSGTFVAARRRNGRRTRSARLAIVTARHFQDEPDWHYKGEMIRAMLAWGPRFKAECTVLCTARDEDAARLADPRELRAFDGFILVAEDHPEMLGRLLDLHRGPVVILDQAIRDLPIIGVVDGSFEGARALTRHLLTLGHRRVAFLGIRNRDLSNPWKFAGYRAALLEKGLPVDENLVATPSAQSVEFYDERFPAQMNQFAREAIKRLLEMDDPPTAIFGFDDHRALPAMREAERRGFRAGENFSIAGFGDSAFRRGLCDRLTSSRIYPRKMGREALRAALGKAKVGESRTIIVPNRLYIRQSTCPPPGTH